MMKIGFDGKRVTRNTTGLGNYSRLVVESLSEFFPDNDYRVYSPGGRILDRAASLLERPNVELVTPDTPLGQRFASLWRVKGITSQLKRDSISLFHGLSNELPLSIKHFDGPTVVTIHDLIFRHFPEFYKPIDRKIYDYKFRVAAQRATRVIAISRFTADDLVNLYGIDPGKIDIIYQGCDPQFHRDVDDKEIAVAKEKYSVTGRYIIGVGTIEPRKNQLLTLKALGGLPDDLSLVLVGRRTPYCQEIESYAAANGLSKRLKIVEGADFKDFPALYAGAELSVYPSRIEGFGIPVIESLGVGTPVVVATGSCLEEAAGEKAIAVDPDNAEQLTAACLKLMDDKDFRQEVIESGRRHARSLTREKMAREIMNTYQKAIKQHDICQKNS